MLDPNKRPIVIKFGGEIGDSKKDLTNLVVGIKKLYEKGEQIVLVHGGGPQATKLSEKLGIETKMVGGRRVTDEATLDVMKMVLAGTINTNMVAALKGVSLPSVTASCISMITAEKRAPKAVSGSNGEVVDFGFVGDIKEVDTSLLTYLLDGNYIPVVNPLTADNSGQILNTNADTVAVEIAKALRAKSFVMITKVGGVFKDLNDKASRFHSLTIKEAEEKIKDGTIQGGMIPKIEEGITLLSKCLDSYHIVGTETPETLLAELSSPGSKGTAIIR